MSTALSSISAPLPALSSGRKCSAGAEPGGVCTVGKGETIADVAGRFGTDVATILALNDIRNPALVHTGQELALPRGAAQRHIAEHGDTLAGLAESHAMPFAALSAANPQIRKSGFICPGEVVTIPALAPESGKARLLGVTDAILGRAVSSELGHSVLDIAGTLEQVSDIHGPIARHRQQRAMAEHTEHSIVSEQMEHFVDSWLAERTDGKPPSPGAHLDYAKPRLADPQAGGLQPQLRLQTGTPAATPPGE